MIGNTKHSKYLHFRHGLQNLHLSFSAQVTMFKLSGYLWWESELRTSRLVDTPFSIHDRLSWVGPQPTPFILPAWHGSPSLFVAQMPFYIYHAFKLLHGTNSKAARLSGAPLSYWCCPYAPQGFIWLVLLQGQVTKTARKRTVVCGSVTWKSHGVFTETAGMGGWLPICGPLAVSAYRCPGPWPRAQSWQIFLSWSLELDFKSRDPEQVQCQSDSLAPLKSTMQSAPGTGTLLWPRTKHTRPRSLALGICQ